MSFVKSKKFGDYAESQVINIFSSLGKTTPNNTIDYDILVEFDIPFTIEVKYDLYAEKSGNIAIEYFNTKKQTASGLYATKADFWVHYLGQDSVFLIKTDKLKEFVKIEKPFKTVDGGDDNASLFLYKKDHILSRFINLHNLSSESIKQIIRGELCLVG